MIGALRGSLLGARWSAARCAVLLVSVALPGCGGEVRAHEEGVGAATDALSEHELDLDLPRERLESVSAAEPRLSPHGGATSRRADAPRARPEGGGAAPPPPPVRSTDDVLRSEIARRVDSIVAAACAEARKVSRGRVTAGDCTVAVHVVPVTGGTPLVARQARAPLVPASNLKVLTVAANATLLGPDAHFETRFDAAGAVRGGALEGDLVVRAGGDPLYDVDAGGSIERWLDDLTTALRASGIQRVDGRLVLDASGWERPGVPDGWPSSRDHWQGYCARSGGFTANSGCLTATVTPTRSGAKAEVALHPLDVGLERRIAVRTGARRSGNDVQVGATATAAVVRGSLGEGDPAFSVEFAHPDPTALFGHAVTGGLARRGIAVSGGFVVADAEPVAPGAPTIAVVRSPMRAAWLPVLRDSHNSTADQLLFATAHRVLGRGDRVGARATLERTLERLGISTAGLDTVDGSGLSKVDRCTAEQLTAVLAAIAAGPVEVDRAFTAALPLAGDSGKLVGRMRGTPAERRVRAKTGFVNGASSLSGFVETVDGVRLAFSILVNYPPVSGLNNAAWKPMQDELCALFAEVRLP